MLKIPKHRHTIVVGMRSSGSTWLYNVVRLGFSQNINSGYGSDPNFPSHLTVIKKHDFSKNYVDGKRFVIMSVRDPRDMAASAIRRNIASDSKSFLDIEYRNYMNWKPYVNMEIRYEDIVYQPVSLVEKILRAIGSEKDPVDVEKQVANLPLPQHHDILTQLWHNHRTNGKVNSYMETFNGNTVSEIEKTHREFILATGYLPHEHLFVCCPNNSGSTILYMLLRTSPGASCLQNDAGIIEGHMVDGIDKFMPVPDKIERGLFSVNSAKFSNYDNYNWCEIKNKWYALWDMNKTVLIEKSPTNVYRMGALQDSFNNPKFIIMVRNPYAACEGIMRNVGCSAVAAAEHWVATARQQQINSFEKRTLSITYENLVNNTDKIINELISFCPELIQLNSKCWFNRPRYECVFGIVNQNEQSINRISAIDFELMKYVFQKNQDVVDFWGYSI